MIFFLFCIGSNFDDILFFKLIIINLVIVIFLCTMVTKGDCPCRWTVLGLMHLMIINVYLFFLSFIFHVIFVLLYKLLIKNIIIKNYMKVVAIGSTPVNIPQKYIIIA